MKWTDTTVSAVASMVGGGTPSKSNREFWAGDIPWVSPKDMGVSEIVDTEDHISWAAIDNSATQLLPAQCVLVVVRSGVLVRRFPVAITRRPVALNQDMKGLIPKPGVTPDFLAYFLRRSEQVILSSCVKRGATVHSVDMGKLKALPLPLPPPSEQFKVVELLDQADALRKRRAEADKKAERILPALFQRIFGDPVLLARSRSSKSLRELNIEVRTGFACGEKNVSDGTPHLRMNNIGDDGFLNLALVRTVPKGRAPSDLALCDGDVLFMATNSEEKVGKACLFSKPDDRTYMFSNHLARIRSQRTELPGEYVAVYLHLLWRAGHYSSLIKRWVNQAAMHVATIADLRIHVPRSSDAVRFSTAWHKINDLRIKTAVQGTEIELLWRSMLHRAFTGDLTAKWREAHMKELLQEMESQAKELKRSEESS